MGDTPDEAGATCQDSSEGADRLRQLRGRADEPEDSKAWAGVLCAGFLICVVFSIVGRAYGPGGHVAPPQHDSLMYQQYARSMAEGHPFRYNPSDPPSTGSTSYLYPPLLALLYALGAQGDALPTAGFLLAAALYLVFLYLFWKACRLIAPDAAPLAAWMCALSGHTAITALGQSDMGLFMVLSTGAVVAALAGRPVLCAIVLAAAAWCRPEGGILAGLLVAACLIRFYSARTAAPASGATAPAPPRTRGLLLAGLAGVAAFAGVLALNRALTGTTTFQSVVGKAPMLFYPPLEVAFRTFRNVADAVQEAGFGVAGEPDRRFLLLPVVGGALALWGMASRWRVAPRTGLIEVWWVAAAAVSLFVVALSDWSGFFHDRYLGWIVPIGILYAAIGARALARRFASVGAASLLGGALLLYQGVGLAYYTVVYAQDTAQLAPKVDFARNVSSRLGRGTVVGTGIWSGLAYYMPNLVSQNLVGITSPQFAQARHFVTSLEIYRHHPELRCEAWIVPVGDARTAWFADAIGEQLMASTAALGEENALGLYAAYWDFFDHGTEPLLAAALEKVRDMRLADRVDVGFDEDEKRTGYSIYSRVQGAFVHPMSKVAEVAQDATEGEGEPPATIVHRKILDVGRVVFGSETFRVRCRPGKPMRVVARLALDAKGLSNFPRYGMRAQNFEFASPLRIRPFVNGQFAGEQTLDVPSGAHDFYEMAFDIPGEMLQGNTAQITVGGDHIAFGYWFYQAEE